MKTVIKKVARFFGRVLVFVGLKKSNRISEMVTNILSRIEIVDNFTERFLYLLLKPLHIGDKDLKVLKNILTGAIMLVLSFRHLLLDVSLLLCFLMAWYKQKQSDFFRKLNQQHYINEADENGDGTLADEGTYCPQ